MLTSLLAVGAIVASYVAPPVVVVGVQAWTFNRFTLYEAVERARKAGARTIEMFPGQKLRPGSDLTVGPSLPESENLALLAHLKTHDVAPVAYGVTGVPTEPDQARVLFRWAKRMGIGVVNTESVEAIDTIEAMVKEFDVKVGFHDHPKRPDDPSYRLWDPEYVYDLVKARDKRIGACADTGHWVRSGIKPVDAIRSLKGRIVSSHLKDLTAFELGAHDVPFGTGVSDMAGILGAFVRIGFRGPASVEYEHNWDDNVSDVAACLGFVRGYFGAK